MRTRLLTAVLLAGVLAVTASAAAAAAPIAHSKRASDVVIRVSTGGGFVAPRSVLGALPQFSLFGDGTVLVPAVVPQIFPGPAISPLVRTRMSEARVQVLLRRARTAGLLAPGAIDYGDMGSIGVADAPTTTVRLQAGGRKVVLNAYALEIDTTTGRLPPSAARARKALAAFIAALPHGLGGARYVPRALAIDVSPYDGQATPAANTVSWPLASDLATVGTKVASGLPYRCTVVGGAGARTLLAALRRANEQSRWVVRGHATVAYGLIVRPLLPDQRGCRSAAG